MGLLAKSASEIEQYKETIERQQQELGEKNNRIAILENELIRRSTVQRQQIPQQPYQILRNWIIKREDVTCTFSKADFLGSGTFGYVFKGSFHGSPVAVKELRHLTAEHQALFEREMEVAASCHHPNVLQIFGFTRDQGVPLIVMELLDCSLSKFIGKYKHDKSQNPGKCLAMDIARGLCYLHSKDPPIIHRDIKSDNILLKKEGDVWKAKVGDYGTAKFHSKKMTPKPGTFIYAAPEAQTTDEQSSKVSKNISFLSSKVIILVTMKEHFPSQ